MLANKHVSRAKMVLATALNSSDYQKKTLQEKAQQFGFKVVSVSEFKKKLNDIKISRKRDHSPADTGEPGPQHNYRNEHAHPNETSVRGLRAPFIKVEDHSGKHYPIFKDFDAWPTTDIDNPMVWKGGNSRHLKNSGKQQEIERFCECCQSHYTNLNCHLEFKEHRSFAENDKNYEAVNKLIKRGLSMDELVENAIKKRT